MLNNKIIDEFISEGILVIPNYKTLKFCETAVDEMDEVQKTYSKFVISKRSEDTSGDFRMFKIENKSKSAEIFKNDTFIKNIFNQYSNSKFESHFVLGGIVKAINGLSTNSGGGWHRDSNETQLKAMLYLTDVNPSNGPFLFIRNSDKYDLKRREDKTTEPFISKIIRIIKGKKIISNPRYTDYIVEKEVNKDDIVEVFGKAGTLVLFDSSFIHRGKNIEKGIRYTLTNYFFKKSYLSRFIRNRQFGKYFLPA